MRILELSEKLAHIFLQFGDMPVYLDVDPANIPTNAVGSLVIGRAIDALVVVVYSPPNRAPQTVLILTSEKGAMNFSRAPELAQAAIAKAMKGRA